MGSLTTKIINGRPYLYLRETARVGGRSKVVKTTYLGKPEDLARRLREGAGEPRAVEVRGFGAVAAALRVARELGIAEAIDGALPASTRSPSTGELIELAAINRAVQARSKRQLADWFQRTALVRLAPKPVRALSSQRFWDAMDRLSEPAIRRAEEEIVGRALERFELALEPLVYDTTNFATFVDSANERNTLARRGHAKGGRRDLRLIGLALCVALDGGVPLAHQAYEGNRNDAGEFPEALALIAERLEALGLGGKDLTLVFDKGNNSRHNQALADELELAIVGSLRPKDHPDLLLVHRSRFRSLADIAATSAYRTSKEVYGRERTIVVSHSEEFERKQARGFAQTLTKARLQLRELKAIVERGRHRMDERALQERIDDILHRRWLSEVVSVGFDLEARRLSFRTDQQALQTVRAREWGKRIIFTDRHDWSDEQIVRAYRSQAQAEESFRQMKDPDFASFSPAFHWTDQKLKVHAFYCTLALSLVQLIEREVHRAGIDLGPKLALRALSEIHETTLIYPPAGGKQGRPRVRTRLAAMDATQQKLFDALALADLAPTL
jgi:transposase